MFAYAINTQTNKLNKAQRLSTYKIIRSNINIKQIEQMKKEKKNKKRNEINKS